MKWYERGKYWFLEKKSRKEIEDELVSLRKHNVKVIKKEMKLDDDIRNTKYDIKRLILVDGFVL